MNLLLKTGAGVAAFALLGCVAWVLLHLRGIRREAAASEAIPRSGPRANFIVLISTAAIALSSLLIFCLTHLK